MSPNRLRQTGNNPNAGGLVAWSCTKNRRSVKLATTRHVKCAPSKSDLAIYHSLRLRRDATSGLPTIRSNSARYICTAVGDTSTLSSALQSGLREPLKSQFERHVPGLGVWNNPTSEGRFCPHLRRHFITALDSVLWLSMPVLDYDSIKRGIAIIAALGMLAPLNSLAEIIDYHQHLYSPAGRRTIISGTEGHRCRLPRCTTRCRRNQPSCRSVGRVQLLKSK